MSVSDADKPEIPSDEQLAAMSRDELVKLGTNLDGVEIVYREPRWPVEGTKAEKRAERLVALWFALGGVFGLALLGVFLFWPWEYKPFGDPGNALYNLATPLYGLTLGLSVLSLGIGAVLYTKKFIPQEISIQDRHDGPGSAEVDRKTIVAQLQDTLDTSTLPRRKMIVRALGFGVGAMGAGTAVAFIGGMIKNPWAKVVPTANGKQPVLLTSGWTPRYHGETIYLGRAVGSSSNVLLKIRPEDIDAGGMETVFPWRESDGDGTTVESHEKLSHIQMGIRNPVMLIRVRPTDMPKVVKRKGQENFNYGDLFAYTKICSHLGCPTSLFEQQTYRILCPCHQSQFDALHFAKPIFGPAARALAQLPLTVDKDGYLVANGDFVEPVGPAFWERKS
ncbi:Probable ubiquinol-cytochrome c reductase iron-sulfur subunit (Rieske iron-sulfur protein) [Mycobacteroides abscessus]|uniref:Cytochrome bc1 complex Rieske iron-sulfur subunit n=5 Tax=Mycobacteroides abscessus TaxID=36809 RepID=A0A1U3HY00_9MYCO|nr:menaquinol-cytochrome C reductase iron-sulfur subunit [Mycobacteroides abscessus subsp. massiliense str. GO 06]AGM28557.1 ubiquinol-cytochrome c reductase iron-sulfur subunit [Mycobacteroides abscessus subsp. bolletii 50594]ARQ67138.1 menaquinol-cytochrome C reductase [Mycobacteroides abscessus subsp. massiliense]AWG57302.1 ubiquinol-cytochrome c reductase iron-sulfur subunit [Mycobacteroides abscessus]EHB99594.1 ubiquinol-cytochrome c reductase iron-sulfur subunit [Mycobacteroides abscessus